MPKGDKYVKLTKYLINSGKDIVELTYNQLDNITGGLPDYVSKYPHVAFNDSSGHSLSYGWLNAGYSIKRDTQNNTFTFTKTSKLISPNSKSQDIRKSPKLRPIVKSFTKPTPSIIGEYLNKWDHLENYAAQENALDKLFFEILPNNSDLNDILIKTSVLNDFYSTHIFRIYEVAKYYQTLNIDELLTKSDMSLVEKLSHIPGRKAVIYSFATKYCSHHKPSEYPIYDSYVDKMLCHLKHEYKFTEFDAAELKDFPRFRDIIIKFQKFFGLEQFTVKEIDKYLWLAGKEYFPKTFSKR